MTQAAENPPVAVDSPTADGDQTVLSWFGWGIEDLWLRDNDEYEAWYARLDTIVAARGWRYLRRWNNIDFILERPGGSIGRRDLFCFQREFDALNRELGFRFSGALYLMTRRDSVRLQPDWPWEQYDKGRLIWGDSVGRPQHHRISA